MAEALNELDYEQAVQVLVTEDAPRLFAVVQDYREREDARVAAWGLAFDDSAEVFGVDGGTRIQLSSPERATRFYTRKPDVTARVIWAG